MKIETIKELLQDADKRYEAYRRHAYETSSIRKMNIYMVLANKMQQQARILSTQLMNYTHE